ELWRMAQSLRSKGLTRVTGGIVIDESYFDSHYYPHKGGNEGRAYTAMTGAVAVNFNSIGVTVSPGRRPGAPGSIELSPPIEGYKIVNKLVTRQKSIVSVAMKSDSSGDTIIVTGRVTPKATPQTYWRSVNDPAIYAGRVIAYVLSQNGISVDGPILTGRVPQSAHTISIEPSRSLADLVSDMNKHSNNFMAEQLLKHLGAARMGPPGSTEKGVKVVSEFLASIGVRPGTYDLENGSGLSENTRITASQLVKVLVATYRNQAIRNEFISSLSVLGVDGTMKKWNRVASELTGTVYAKTGTLNGVSTLAGYVPMRDGRMAAFAILANDLPKGVWGAHEAELAVVRSIAEGER
ncbi:MAG: D-alanyl-D-alanine carboxypeptidase/D-alanyl-D-alanine-endopeptidase, partial [bacterium]